MLRSKLIPLTLAAVLLGGCVAAPTGTGDGGTLSAKRKAKTVDKSQSTNDDDEFPEDDGSDEGGDDTGNTGNTGDTNTNGDSTATDTTTGDTTATNTTNTGDTTASGTVSPASITAINPPNGGPGTVVTLTGTGFRQTQNTAFKVFFGETEASSATRDSDTSITATVPTVSSGPANVTVKFGTVTSNSFAFRQPKTISLNGSNNQVTVGGTLSFPYTVLDSEGNAMTSPNLAWTIEDSAIATVSAMGLVTGVKVGSTKLTANAGSVTGSVTVNVVAEAQTVTTYAGSGTKGSGNGTVTEASFNVPGELVVTPGGDVWVADLAADSSGLVARRIDPVSQAVTALSLSPNGTAPAEPVTDVAFAMARVPEAEGGGMLLLSGASLRRVAADGTVTLPTDVSAVGFTGGAIAAGLGGVVYLADTTNNTIKQINPDGTVDVIAGTSEGAFADGSRANARFDAPSDIAFVSGMLYVVDSNNNRIRRINLAGNPDVSTYVTTVAGGDTAGFADGTASQARFDLPRGFTFASDGCLYVADVNNHRIRRIDINAGQASADFVTTVAGSGTPGFQNGSYTSARFSMPTDVAEGAPGELLVTDAGNFRIRRIQLEQ